MIDTEPNKNKFAIAPLIGLIVMTAFEFLAAAVIHFRLFPFLQADTLKFGRAGNQIPTDQFVAWAVPIFIALGCFPLLFTVWVIARSIRKAD
jgi:FlaG/FlaF family flagellin (archaellin)